MRQAKWDTLPDDVRAVRERFEAWRQSRLGRSRIPAALWIVAAECARRHSVHRVARALALNDHSLKQRILAATPTSSQPEPPEPALANSSPSAMPEPKASAHVAAQARAGINAPLPVAVPPGPAFIQLPWPTLASTASAALPRCVVELLHPGGARMTITLEGFGGAGHAPAAPPRASSGLDLAALVQSFWSRPA